MKDFQEDAAKLAGHGYTIASQVQSPGGRTVAASVFIVLGVFFLVVGLFALPFLLVAGVLLVIGLVSGKSADELAVVWRLEPPAAAASAQAPPSLGPTNTYEAIDALAALRDKGAITPEEYEAKKAELLGRL
jgi:hypothetical protein